MTIHIQFDYATAPAFTNGEATQAWLRAWREQYRALTDRIRLLKRWSASLHKNGRADLAAIDQRNLSWLRYVASEMMLRRAEARVLTRAHAAKRQSAATSIAA